MAWNDKTWTNRFDGGPWDFTKSPIKNYYNEGTHISHVSDPTWNQTSDDHTPERLTHIPCGYWPKLPYTVETATSGPTETYIELLSSGCCMPDTCKNYQDEEGPAYDVTFVSTYRPLDTADYDSDETTYVFEITASNISWINDGYVYLVDDDDNIVATIVVPQGYRGPYTENSDGTGAVRYRARQYWLFSVEFTPPSGQHQYGLRLAVASTGYQDDWYEAPSCVVKIPSAKIRVKQKNPLTSVVHIPMFTLVNWCHMDWTGAVDEGFGQHAVSVGHEAGGPDIDVFSYADCEDPNATYEEVAGCKQTWKFDAAQLSTLDKVVLDAAVVYYPSGFISTSSMVLFGTPTYTWANIDLRWSTYYTSSAGTLVDGSPGSAVAHDASGHTFTGISGSEVEWGYDADGLNWQAIVELDISSLTAADGSYLYLCSLDNVYGGDTPSGPYAHWPRYRTFSIPAGRTIARAWITYTAYLNTTLSRYEVKAVFDYELVPAGICDAYIMLYDVTADSYVEGSELAWHAFTYWERKSVELDGSLLTSGHEYRIRWRIDDVTGGTVPYCTDANLWLKVTEVSKFTSWLRTIKGSMQDWRFPGIYDDYFDTGTDTYLDVAHRTKPYLPAGSSAHYELGYFDTYNWPSKIALVDTGDAVSGIGTNTEVPDGVFVVGTGDEKSKRNITSKLSLSENYYISNLYAHYEYSVMVQSGFIVVEYNL